ncbi:MAG: sensor histidine kinase [Balneolaceae bacterium]
MEKDLNIHIKNSDQPEIIVNTTSDSVIDANSEASRVFKLSKSELLKMKSRNLFKLNKPVIQINLCTIHEKLFNVTREIIETDTDSYARLILTELSGEVTDDDFSHYSVIAEQFVHQFRSPLAGISGYLELLREHIETEKGRELLGKTEPAMNELFTMLDRIEEFAQPVSANITTFSFDQFQALMNELIGSDEIKKVTIQNEDQIKTITSDYYLLGKIIMELLVNALEASSRKKDDSVILSFSSDGKIEVENSISPAYTFDISRLYIPFYSTKAKHLGIGLALCEKYCRKLNLTLSETICNKTNTIRFQIRNVLMK